MSDMVQGDSYNLDVTVKNNGADINIADIETIEFILHSLKKMYPEGVAYEDGKFHISLSQQETFRLPRLCQMQVRVKFKSGDVIGSEIKQIDVERSLSKAVL